MNHHTLTQVVQWAKAHDIPLQSVALVSDPPPTPHDPHREFIEKTRFGWLLITFTHPTNPAVSMLLARTIEESMHRAEDEFLERAFVHEVMNSLAVLSGHVELLADECPNAHRSSLVQAAVSQVRQRLDDWIRKYRPIQSDWFRLDQLCRKVLVDLQPEICNRRVRTVITGWRGEICSDRARVEQILFNLVKNSLEAIGPQGRVELSIDRYEAGVVCRIKDSGQGIPESVRSHLFEAYHTTKEYGHGIGVALSFRLANSLGGRLEYREDSLGPAFFLFLPVPARP